jgi:N-acetylglucosaminyl-diphospho-decaprenol L-rhamnosyltransferase
MSGPQVGVIVVTYNSAGVVRGCLVSLRRQAADVALQVVVVDNGSQDGTRALVRAEFPEVHLVEAPRNGGFSYGTNLGLRALGLWPPTAGPGAPDYVLFLNPDTALPAGALGALVRLLEQRPEVGAVTPRLVRADGSLDRACRRGLPTPWNALCHFLGLARLWPHSPRFGQYNLTYLPEDQPTAVDCIAGAFMLVRAAAVWQVGPWDEAFFAYGEDIDYCLRLRRAGWTLWYEPSVQVLHLKGEASRQRSLPMLREFYRAMAIYYRKHHAARDPLPLRLAILGGIRVLYAAALLRQLLQPPGRRWVGAARPTANERAR